MSIHIKSNQVDGSSATVPQKIQENVQQTIHARTALLSEGWVENVSLTITDGNITDIGQTNDQSGTQPVSVDLLLPAPTNLHSHAFQRAMAGMTESRRPGTGHTVEHDSFWTWRKQMYRFLDHLTPDDVQAISALVQMEMLESGYAAVGEFHYLHHQVNGEPYTNPAEMSERVAAAAEQTGIGLTLLPVVYEHGGCDGRPLGSGQRRFGCSFDEYSQLYERARSALGNLPPDSRLGVAPHSLRAVSQDTLKQATELEPDGVLHIHVAEQKLEVEEVATAWGKRPVEWLLDNHDVNQRWCLIHCTQMNTAETTALAASGAVVGLCPITESSLGDGIFNGSQYLTAGGKIGIGSDSNVRISLSEEIRTLEYSQRLRDQARAVLATPSASTGRFLYDKLLAGGAQACDRNAGQIQVGKLADLVALNTRNPTLAGLESDQWLDGFVFAADDQLVTDVWSAGRHVVQQGVHRHRDAIVARYMAMIKHLKQRSEKQ